MIGHFPEPYPDELLYSLCARFGDRMQYPSKWAVMRDLFGKGTATAIVDLPSRLGFFADVLPPRHPCKAVDRVIDDHTLLPFYGPFQPVERLGRIREDMLGSKGPRIYARAGLTPSPVQRPTWLRFCPLCVEGDRKRFGECYWHRIHQVPGVEVCPVHEVFLKNSNVRACNSKTRYEFVSAECAIQEVKASSPPSSVSFRRYLVDIAHDAAWLLDQRGLVAGPESLCQQYKLLLADRGLATYSGIVNTSALIESLTAHYLPEFLALFRCEIGDQIRENWLARLTRSRCNSQHPLQHLLLIHYLGYTAEAFFELPTEIQPFGSGPWPCLNDASHHYGQPRIEECQIAYDRHGHPWGTFTCSCGFVYLRRGPDRSAKDRFRMYCYKSIETVPEEGARELCENSHADPAQEAQRLAIERHTATLDATEPGLPPLPPPKVPTKRRVGLAPPRVNWAERDERLAGEVKTAVQHLKHMPGRPVRISVEAIGRQVGQFRALRSGLDRLPLTSKALAELVETPEAFAVRRILWAVELYQREGVCPKRWQLIERASIKPKHLLKWPLVQQALEAALQMTNPQHVSASELRR